MPDCPSTVRGPGGAGGTSAFGPGSWDGGGAGVGSDGVTCTDGYTGTPAVSSRPGSGRAQGERSSGISLPVLQLRARPPPGGGTVGRLALRGRYRRIDAHHRRIHLVSPPGR